jgi:hypothetical protein
MKKILLAPALAAAQIATSLPVTAAKPPANRAKPPPPLHEFDEIVVVTAERRRTDLQKTPDRGDSVLTGEDIANSGRRGGRPAAVSSRHRPWSTTIGQGIDFNIIRGIGKADH